LFQIGSIMSAFPPGCPIMQVRSNKIGAAHHSHSGARVFARTRNPGCGAGGEVVWIPGSVSSGRP
jgi:hypothetical protein